MSVEDPRSNVPIELARRRCMPCEGELAPLTREQAGPFLKGLPDWRFHGDGIHKTHEFNDFHAVMAFVNAIAWISHREDHHPDLIVGYNSVLVKYMTHAIAGLSENDFICAAKVDALLEL